MYSGRLCLLVLALIAAGALALTRIEANSFFGPFLQTDKNGKRMIPNWTTRGDAFSESFRNFVRLTGDREDARGSIWGTEVANAPEWAVALRFRLSGRLRWKHGDGFALWLTKTSQRFAMPVTKFGAGDEWDGLGLFFDTTRVHFRGRFPRLSLINSPSAGKARYPPAEAEPTPPGCYHGFRYDETRHDFGARNYTTALITYRNGRVRVGLANAGAGDMVECIDHTLEVKLPTDIWIGMSASCGERTDNHDILSLSYYDISDHREDDDATVLKLVQDKEKSLLEKPMAEAPVEKDVLDEVDRIIRNTHTIHQIDDALDHLQHEFEHKLLDFKDSLTYSLTSLEEMGFKASKEIDSNALKIKRLQATLSKELDASDEIFISQEELTDMDAKLEGSIKQLWATERNFEARLAAIEKTVDSRYKDRIEGIRKKLDSMIEATGDFLVNSNDVQSWQIPLFCVVLLIGGIVFWTYREYRTILKKNNVYLDE